MKKPLDDYIKAVRHFKRKQDRLIKEALELIDGLHRDKPKTLHI